MIFGARAGLTVALALVAGASHGQSFGDLIGRELSNQYGHVVIEPGGRLVGEFNGAGLHGRWWVQDGLFCRDGQIGDAVLERQCQTIRIQGDHVSFFNSDGTPSGTYRMETLPMS